MLYTVVNLICRGMIAVLGLYASGQLGFSGPATAGLVAAAVAAMRFGRIIVAPLARLGSRPLVVGGFVLSGLGLLSLAAAPEAPVLAWLGVIAVGTGYGADVLAIKVALVAQAVNDDQQRLRLLSYLTLAVNVGAAAGPATAGLLVAGPGATTSFLVGSVASFGAAVAAVAVWPTYSASAGTEFRWSHLRRAADRGIRFPLLTLVVAFFLYAQLSTALPLRIAGTAGPQSIGTAFILNAFVVIALQLPITRFTHRFPASERYAPAAGFVFYAAGLSCLITTSSLPAILACVLLISIAECLLLPYVESELARRFQGRGLTVAFSLTAAAMGIGETAGSVFGVSAALDQARTFPILMGLLALTGLTFAVITALITRTSPATHPQEAAAR